MNLDTSLLRSACTAVLVVGATSASAQSLPPPPQVPHNVLHLQASASTEVPQDLITVVLSATREGADAAGVQQALKQAMDAALGEARRVAKPGQIDVHTGNFSLYPRHNAKGAITGWQGQAELVLEGRDIPGIAQLAGRLPSVTVQRMGWGLSREAREKVEADLTAQAVQRFRSRAADQARLFGMGGYTIREVTIAMNDPIPGPVPMMMKARGAMEAADAPVPVEPGRGTVTVSVSGSVQMTARP